MNTFKVVSDVICPWCYIGKRRLEAALDLMPADARISVSWHPFQLNPHMPAHGMDRKEYCTRKFGSWSRCEEMYEQICAVGKSVGINFRFDLQPTIPNTFDSHRLLWLAGREGAQDAVMEALFRGYFCEGVDIANRSELVEIAVAAGLERPAVEGLLNSDLGAAEIQQEEQEIKLLGVSSVPFFIINDLLAISGAQPPETLVSAFEQACETRQKQRVTSREKVDSGYHR